MEVTVASWVAVILVALNVVVRSAWSVLDWVWLKPKKLERCLREQGLQGNSYRLLYGDTKEESMMCSEASSKPINLSTSHDTGPHIDSFVDKTVKTYGKNSFVWIGPVPRVNIMNPEEVKEIFTRHDEFCRPVSNPLLLKLTSGLFFWEGEKWRKHRRIINPTFHFEKLKLMIPAFHQCFDEMIKEWESLVSEEGSSAELDVWPSLQNMTANVISRTAFGTSYLEGKKMFELLKEQTIHVTNAAHGIYIPGWRFLPTKRNRMMNEINKEIYGILGGIIENRLQAIKAGEATKDDLLGALLESNLKHIEEYGKNNKNAGMSIKDVSEECKLFYFAGQETTSVLLVWTMVLLSQYQNWQDRAREEVLLVFGSNKPDFNGLTHLKVVTMILHEVLRLYPPIVEHNRTIPKKTQLGKYSLPAGVEVRVPALLIHHDKELWGDDANEFKPERFAEGVSKATTNRLSFFPFGAGPRICIGQNFAMTEAKLALALILQQFTFELSPSYAHSPSYLITLQPQYGAPIILHRR